VSDSSPDDATPDAHARKQAVLDRASALVGSVISDRYRVEEVIAAGGMGCVYRGQHIHMRKRVAIKILLPDTEGLPDLVTRFEREAIAGAHIDHPNVAAATDFGTLPDGSYFLILQYIRGITLHDLIQQGPVPPARAVRIARQLAAALDACHQMGVIHRDLKPRNIMLEEGRNDSVKLIDFGLAKVPMDRISTIGVHESFKSTREVAGPGVVFGTIAYMAPEAEYGMGAIDERSDLYAFGVILYELLAGVHPFDTVDPAELFQMHREVMPPPIRVRAPEVVDAPARVEAVAMRLLQKDPQERYASARAVIAALDAAMPSAALDLGAPSVAPGTLPVRLAGAVPSPPPMPVPPPIELNRGSIEGGVRVSGSPSGVPSLRSGPVSGAYEPRLGRSGPVSRVGGSRTPTWAIAAALALGGFAAATTVLLLWQSRGGDLQGGGPPAKVLVAEDPLERLSEAASEATKTTEKAEEPPTAAAETEALKTRMRVVMGTKDWSRGTDALLALAELDPKAFEAPDIAASAVAITAGIEHVGDERSNKVFELLTNKLGLAGLDILFEIMSTRGGSRAAARATEILRRKDVLERASPALRIAIDLREIPCKDKLTLLARAKTEGDIRAIAFLDILRSETCNPRAGQCCYRHNTLVDEAIHLIRARLRESAPAPE
jgi:serine/threonine-protein kinase